MAEEKEGIIKMISQKIGGIVFESDDDLDVWINMDKSKSKELKEKIKDLKRGDKVKIKGFDMRERSYYTDVELIEEAKEVEPEEIKF